MKVLLVNGSPHEHGCTARALREIADTLASLGIETETLWLGLKPIPGCLACGKCRETRKCVFDDAVNRVNARASEFDGFVFGSPVYWAGASGQLTSFLDRLFYSCDRKNYAFKPVTCVCSARRAGTTATLDQLHKYFYLLSMPIITATYWNEVHGFTPEQVEQDGEGLQTMRNLARNMNWFLRMKEAAGLPLPEIETKYFTNFIR